MEDLKPCPFCGSDNIVLIHTGNDHTRSRSVTVKCKKCICKRTTGAIANTLDWCEAEAISAWNTRADTELVTALEKAYGMISTEKGYCPQCGDGTGAYYDNQGEICQCQWCYEAVAIKAALVKHRGE